MNNFSEYSSFVILFMRIKCFSIVTFDTVPPIVSLSTRREGLGGEGEMRVGEGTWSCALSLLVVNVII